MVPPQFAVSSRKRPYQVHSLYLSSITGTPVAAYFFRFGAQLAKCIRRTFSIASQLPATLSRFRVRLLLFGHRFLSGDETSLIQFINRITHFFDKIKCFFYFFQKSTSRKEESFFAMLPRKAMSFPKKRNHNHRNHTA